MAQEEDALPKNYAKQFKGFKPYTRSMLLQSGIGFHFSAPPPPDIRSARYLDGDDQQDTLACILANAQVGEFEPTKLLPALMRANDDARLWSGSSMLLSYAAPASVLRDFAASFWEETANADVSAKERGTMGEWVIETLANSSCLWAVPLMMQYYTLMPMYQWTLVSMVHTTLTDFQTWRFQIDCERSENHLQSNQTMCRRQMLFLGVLMLKTFRSRRKHQVDLYHSRPG